LEFELIKRHFTRPVKRAQLGVGDDCALLDVAPGRTLAISTDTLVSGVHFFADVSPTSLGHKALAVNLSDLAAMGATPRAFTLALTLPTLNDDWLTDFSRGLCALADAHDCELIGGDTTRGPLSITITVMGELDVGLALRRDAAQAGDDLWVSGTLGGAALGLRHLQGAHALPPDVASRAIDRLERPTPRIALGRALLGVAHAAIDISDGLLADLGHVLTQSNLDATLEWARVPLHPTLLAVPPDVRTVCALAGGDDYELCFTAPQAAREAVTAIAAHGDVAVTRIGTLTAARTAPTFRVVDAHGQDMPMPHRGYDHFASGAAQ
jgi:thiamine-monophosphate kinase